MGYSESVIIAGVVGLWQIVTPQTLLEPVPEIIYPAQLSGAVEQSRNKSKPVEFGCYERDESGKVSGYRLNCEGVQ